MMLPEITLDKRGRVWYAGGTMTLGASITIAANSLPMTGRPPSRGSLWVARLWAFVCPGGNP